MNEWWISLYIPSARFGEFELHSPWWISGYTDDETIIVGAVRADDEEAAWVKVDAAFDNEPSYRQRFCEPLDGQSPFSDRFPKATWMAWTADTECACDLPTCDGSYLNSKDQT